MRICIAQTPYQFLVFQDFKPNFEKYSLSFKMDMEKAAGKQGGGRGRQRTGAQNPRAECAHIKTPLAKHQCIHSATGSGKK